MSARYRVYARDVDYHNLGEIPDYAELKVEPRFNDVGGWYLTAAANSRAASLLTKTGGIIVTRDLLDGTGPSVVFSGPVTNYHPNGQTLEVAGASDELLLQERRASPDPTKSGDPGDGYATEQDIRSGTASTVMLAYVNANAGPSAIARRREEQLVMGTDLGLGSVVYGQARWIPLLALLQELAQDGGGLRFQVLQSDLSVAQIVFTVSAPSDRTATAIISNGRGTLGPWERTVTRPTATWVLVAGQGQGINRQIVQGGDGAAAAEYGRYAEEFIDARDTNDELVLEQRLRVALAESGESSVVNYVARDTPSFRWGREYDLGDLVTVQTGDGESLSEVVRGVDLTLTAPGGNAAPVVQPIVSTPGDTADDPASRQKRAVGRRVSNLERNIDSLAAALSVQWNVGDYRMTARAAAAAGWLLCDGSTVSRTTYSALFGVIGTTFGVGNGTTTFTLPDFDQRFPVGADATFTLNTYGGAAAVDASHTHAAGTLAGPSHTHAGPSHTHGAGTLAGPSHTHTGPSHTHAAGTLAGPSHDHSGSSLSISGNTAGPSATSTRADGANPVASDSHTHGVGTLDVAGNTAAGGTGSVTGSVAADGTGNTGASGTGSVTGATAADGTGATGSSGTASVTGATATGGSSALSTVPLYVAVHYEIYAGV